MTNEERIKEDVILNLESHLKVGVAICEIGNLQTFYENEIFSNWFLSKELNLEKRIDNLNVSRLIKRTASGKEYSVNKEIKDGHRNRVIRVSFSLLETDFLLLKAEDISKVIEMEYMLDSYAKIAEQNKRELERALKKIEDQNRRMLRELEIARQVQMGMLPFNFNPENDNLKFASLLNPAKEVGGDFFDIFYIDKDHLCYCLGDVSDKGAGSALFMAATKTLIKMHATNARSVVGILDRVNKELSVNNEKCMFTTLFLGIFNTKSGELLYANCGHCSPILIDETNKLRTLNNLNGPALGVLEDAVFTEQMVKIVSGQSILIYSDGVTEAINAKGELFGDDRLTSELLSLEADSKPEEIINHVYQSVSNFEVGTDQSDDITLINVKYV